MTASEAHRAGDGEVLVRLDVAITAILSVLSALTWLLADRIDRIYSVVSVVLFFTGAAVMALGLWNGIQRSRVEDVTLVGLAAISKTHVPARVRNLLWAMIFIQIGVTVLFASLRPFTEQAFGILAPTFGLGVAVLWSSRFGSFHRRD